MIDTTATTLAFRNRMLALVVATTGSQTLSATATGFARATGSFLTDGFADGMEFTATGFSTSSNNGAFVIDSASALSLTTTVAPTAEAPAAARTLTVGIPQGRAFDNRIYRPTAGRPYIEEDLIPGGQSLTSFPAQGGWVNEDGLYVIRWYGLEGKGSSGIRKAVDALKDLFAAGTVLVAGSDNVRVRTDTSVTSGQILPQGNGWAVCTVTVPWWAMTQNVVAA